MTVSHLPFLVPQTPAAPDVVGMGGVLAGDVLRAAYRAGVFPWPHEGYPLLWFCPRRRGILELSDLHIGERLARTRRNSSFTFTVNRDFPAVIAACQSVPRMDQDGTWITPEIISAYTELHRAGDAHSVEAWDEAGNLVGGLYGVSVAGCFAGESMFAHKPNASKLAFLFLCDRLREYGLSWIDIQMVTPVFAQMGGTYISRAAFLRKLRKSQDDGRILFPNAALGTTSPV